jgi:hypothetical protein
MHRRTAHATQARIAAHRRIKLIQARILSYLRGRLRTMRLRPEAGPARHIRARFCSAPRHDPTQYDRTVGRRRRVGRSNNSAGGRRAGDIREWKRPSSSRTKAPWHRQIRRANYPHDSWHHSTNHARLFAALRLRAFEGALLRQVIRSAPGARSIL